MSAFTELVGIERPIVQAGMGGGVSRHELAAAVSQAGGLGTICTLPPAQLRAEIAAARRLTGRPVAVNLLLPFAGRGHRRAAAEADVVVTFWGPPDRPTDRTWVHQCGSVVEARTALAAGADAVIAQGVEAGGHVRGERPALELFAAVRAALPGSVPVLVAGGIVDAGDARAALAAGADAVVLGTRFLATEESRAHPAYKRRVVEGDETVLTELFGLGWARAPHRVLPNDATRRWLRRDSRGPGWVRAAQAAAGPLVSRLPSAVQARVAALQRASLPMLSPAPPTDADAEALVDAAALYAGAGVGRIADVRPAAELVRELAA